MDLTSLRHSPTQVIYGIFDGMGNSYTVRLSEDDPWGVSQGLAGSQAIICRRGFANRPNRSEDIPVTVVVMPKVGACRVQSATSTAGGVW